MNEIQMWRHDYINRIVTDGNNEVISTAQIPDTVADEICRMHNAGIGYADIGKYLDKKSPLSTEEVDSVIEQIGKWEREQLTNQSWSQYVEEEHSDDPADAEWIERTDEEIEEDNREPDIRSTVIQEVVEQVNKTQTEHMEDTEIQAAPVAEKKTRTRTSPQKTVGGKVNAEELISKMQEQIELIRYVDGVCAADIPDKTPISKAGRDILIGLQKQIEQAKNDALVAIQSL